MNSKLKLQNELKDELVLKLSEMLDLKIAPLYEIFHKEKYKELEQIDFNDALNDVFANKIETIKVDMDVINFIIDLFNKRDYKPTNIDPTNLNIEGIKDKMRRMNQIK